MGPSIIVQKVVRALRAGTVFYYPALHSIVKFIHFTQICFFRRRLTVGVNGIAEDILRCSKWFQHVQKELQESKNE